MLKMLKQVMSTHMASVFVAHSKYSPATNVGGKQSKRVGDALQYVLLWEHIVRLQACLCSELLCSVIITIICSHSDVLFFKNT